MSAADDGDSTGSRSGAFIAAAIAGQREGEAFIRSLPDFYVDPEALFHLVLAAIDERDPSHARLRGLCRGILKHLERVTA